MHDLATIKRLNERRDQRDQRDKPAPQPTREESQRYHFAGKHAVMRRRFQGVPPAGQRAQGDQ